MGEPETSGQRPNDNTSFDVVLEGNKDIATSALLEKITVGVSGRHRFQKIWVRMNEKGGKTTVSYDEKNDAPAVDRTVSILPTKEEIESRAGTTEFLVVGIVLAEDPYKFSSQGTNKARDKKRHDQRAERGIIPKEKNVLRAIVPITDYISPTSIKYYVACHQTHNICDMRVIGVDAIFYFQEIWEGLSEDVDVKTRRSRLGAACKLHAARDKKPPQRALTSISAKSDSTASNQLSVTPVVNAANVILMQYSMYKASREPSAILALKKTLEDLLPDLLSKPSDEGILGFYTFESVLEEEDAVKAVTAVKT
ncbi:hypothetical protein G7Y89_g8208 [Cudoniella acicularis]|uniref:Uncharacterized protein n=1 Tax=Cudoniella acicularis TaxID=354080 RepID=A0A8H4RHW3_9HELO|nr:hypothetical protein G7Y89_g8208 [Cudoniella acicularis]